ncbi:M20 family metallopeptidase [Dehalogenimonas etheniformans]|uniref:Peptidase M20 domain-containing protein 2 n=1 Tax=Dehalogenimonas etheniformans TaxID=1536648 RepID=A0A2P5P658_9CHLR|nr:M20 family metallopeptidase [Dehalogenimonas etheniformans]PPD57765.1 M20 family peptidase [Dehalogenimonas etheniformans]QNT76106.1 M20 family metallopeptidase [Dehalogenimonas etheniformans]
MKGGLVPLKESIKNSIDSQAPALTKIALDIHDNPELGFHEHQAAAWLTDHLKKNGFTVEMGIADLPTAWKATYGSGKPVIAFVGEYDALPEVGHACGHNLIGTASVGAAVAARQLADKFGGTVVMIGTPAEELYGGKIPMVKKGIFNDLDAAMLVHPDSVSVAMTQALAVVTLYIEYFGREAHASAYPEQGINALDAMVIGYTGVAALRQHIQSSARIHGVITDGGKAANVVPGYSAGNFLVRAMDLKYLEELKERVLNCFRAGALATGAELSYHWDEHAYEPLKANVTLAQLFTDNIKSLGREIVLDDPSHAFGSTDMGNVSQVTPSLHGFLSIAPKDISGHTKEFAMYAASEEGMKAMLDAAAGMAMTAADLFSSPETLARVKAEFEHPPK